MCDPIIDDGINNVVFPLPYITHYEVINQHLRIIEPNHKLTHGTICAAILKKYLSNDYPYDIMSIKILDQSSSLGRPIDFLIAVKWCIEKKVNVINCSFGTIDYNSFHIMNDAIDLAYKNNIHIISAMNNHNVYCLPACSDKVIGVKSSNIYISGKYKFRWYPLDHIEILTSGSHSLKKSTGDIYTSPNANSYAAPVITAQVVKLLDKDQFLNFNQIVNTLAYNATTVIGSQLQNFQPYIWSRDHNEIELKSWDFEKYSLSTRKYITRKHYHEIIDIPVINVQGDIKGQCIKLIELLFSSFQKDYYTKIISCDPSDVSNGYVIVPQGVPLMDFCHEICNFFQNDLLIIYSNQSAIGDMNVKISGFIEIKYDNCVYCDSLEHLDNVVQHIVKLLT